MQYERMEVAGFTYKEANRAKQSADSYYKHWAKSIGADKSVKNLADYYDMKYNNPEEYRLLKQYAKDVETGWITPLSGFDNYKNIYNRIENEIVGKTTANGIVISGQVPHFMQRVIGTMVDPEKLKKDLKIVRRSGVEFSDIVDSLFNPIDVSKVLARTTGQRSVRLIGQRCVVSVNPDTGVLIQTNPI